MGPDRIAACDACACREPRDTLKLLSQKLVGAPLAHTPSRASSCEHLRGPQEQTRSGELRKQGRGRAGTHVSVRAARVRARERIQNEGVPTAQQGQHSQKQVVRRQVQQTNTGARGASPLQRHLHSQLGVGAGADGAHEPNDQWCDCSGMRHLWRLGKFSMEGGPGRKCGVIADRAVRCGTLCNVDFKSWIWGVRGLGGGGKGRFKCATVKRRGTGTWVGS